MRPIQLARLDKTRPVVVLTRGVVRGSLAKVTVAPITSTIHGISSEVPLGRRNGLDADCVISCDNIDTVMASDLGRAVGYLSDDDEIALARAIINAFDLAIENL